MIPLQTEQNGVATRQEIPGAVKLPSTGGDNLLIQMRQRVRGQSSLQTQSVEELLESAQSFADEVAARPNDGSSSGPFEDLKRMAALGFLTAPLPATHGGLGLGTEAGGHLPLLRLLTLIGGGDLVLGRLYEGHVNALILLASYGTLQQLAFAARDVRNGLLFGVWNTGAQSPMLLQAASNGYLFHGMKTFASGASFVLRPIVTADCEGKGWQMTLPRMESSSVEDAIVIDREAWHPLGMEGSGSYTIHFDGAHIEPDDLIGRPGDFYREPMFRGGAIRFAAVHAGAVLRLHRLFACWLAEQGKADDPYQVARLGEVALGAQDAVLWVERAAAMAEDYLFPTADKLATERMVECANMMRISIERIATAAMQRVVAGVGAHGLLQPRPFERIVRDLTMYLRQPSPDQALAEVGRSSLRKNNLRVDGAGDGLWRERPKGSLPPSYFWNIYEHSRDPWNFENSVYEADKYAETLASLRRERYQSALEVGCSIGVLTHRLAGRCDALLSVDVSEKALGIARQRCLHLPQVRFVRMEIPQQVPDGYFDLILISEVAYYWQREDLEVAATLLAARQTVDGQLVLVHYTKPVADYPLTGDEVHEYWLARPEWRAIEQRREEGYRIDVLERRTK